MSEEIKPSVIKETQDALSKYVKKPPLTEKLLKKPPFRYLHDIITVIIKETGFLEGLYTPEELDSNNVKDKESKIAFLDKLINAIKVATGKNIAVRPAKIVAGLEVNKTLELLQLIGKAIDEKVGKTQITEENSKKSDNKPRKSSKDDTKDKKINENISNDAASKPKTNSTKTPTEAKTAVSTKKPNSNTDEHNKQRRNSVTIKQDVLKKGQSVLKKEQPAESTSDVPQSTKEPKTNKISTAKTRVPSRESTSIKRNTAQSKSTPARRSSLKDNSRSVISSARNFQTAIKEEKEENDEHVLTKTPLTKESNKTADTKNTPKNFEKITPNALPEEEENDTIKSNQIRETTVTNDSKAANATEILEKSEKTDKVSAKRKSSITTPRPSSAKPGSRKPIQNDTPDKNSSENVTQSESIEKSTDEVKNRIPSSIRPRTATRPPSARPGAPRIRDRGEVLVADEVSAPTNSVNVIEEGKQDQFGDDKDSFIIIESEQMPPLKLQSEPSLEMKENEQGQLVHQILKTQKELNESVIGDVAQNKHLEIEWEAGREREKDIVAKEIEKIRDSIQTLTSAANPLGKLFDFLQEDVDEMQRELQHWKSVNEKLHKQQLAELEFAKISLQPLQKQLLDVENSIQEEYLQIGNMKMIILNNDEKLLKLVSNTGMKTRVK